MPCKWSISVLHRAFLEYSIEYLLTIVKVDTPRWDKCTTSLNHQRQVHSMVIHPFTQWYCSNNTTATTTMPPFFAHDLDLETTRAHTNKIVMFAAVLLVDRNPLQIEKLKTQLKPKSFRNQKKNNNLVPKHPSPWKTNMEPPRITSFLQFWKGVPFNYESILGVHASGAQIVQFMWTRVRHAQHLHLRFRHVGQVNTHRLTGSMYVWYIHLNLPLKNQPNVGNYAIHGSYGIYN